MTGTTLGN